MITLGHDELPAPRHEFIKTSRDLDEKLASFADSAIFRRRMPPWMALRRAPYASREREKKMTSAAFQKETGGAGRIDLVKHTWRWLELSRLRTPHGPGRGRCGPWLLARAAAAARTSATRSGCASQSARCSRAGANRAMIASASRVFTSP